MKRNILPLVLALGTTLGCTSAFAEVKSCDALKAEIAAKLKAKGVENYSLDVVAADAVKSQKIVGSCEGGSKRIAYARGNMVVAAADAPSSANAADASADASKASSAEASADASAKAASADASKAASSENSAPAKSAN